MPLFACQPPDSDIPMTPISGLDTGYRSKIRVHLIWGEGRHYFDQKRWNVDMVRKSWSEGGNWHPTLAGSGSTGGSYSRTGKNNWCICIPNKETDYNKLINYNIEPENWTKDSPQQ